MDHDIPEVEKEGCVPEFEIGRRMPRKENKIQINIIIPQSDSALTLRPYDILRFETSCTGYH